MVFALCWFWCTSLIFMCQNYLVMGYNSFCILCILLARILLRSQFSPKYFVLLFQGSEAQVLIWNVCWLMLCLTLRPQLPECWERQGFVVVVCWFFQGVRARTPPLLWDSPQIGKDFSILAIQKTETNVHYNIPSKHPQSTCWKLLFCVIN